MISRSQTLTGNQRQFLNTIETHSPGQLQQSAIKLVFSMYQTVSTAVKSTIF